MAFSTQLKLEEVIKALKQLEGEADWHEIREKVTENRGSDYSHYKDYSNYEKVMFQFIQDHCSSYSKWKKKKKEPPVYFEKIGSKTRFKLINHNEECISTQPMIGKTDVYDETDLDNVETSKVLELKAVDIEEPPSRILSFRNRIIRDTTLTHQIKEIHNYKCQICYNDGLKLNNEKLYAEAHHIQPLGKPHNGLDAPQNIICVCPNCHVLLDYGAIRIDESLIKSVIGHEVGIKYIDYHNEHIFGKVVN